MSLSISASDVEEIKEREAAILAAVLMLGGDKATLQALAVAFGIAWDDVWNRQVLMSVMIVNGE